MNYFPEIHRLGEIDDDSWLLGNIDQTGYYRVNYDLNNWRLLTQQLQTNHQVPVHLSARMSVCLTVCPTGKSFLPFALEGRLKVKSCS